MRHYLDNCIIIIKIFTETPNFGYLSVFLQF